VYVLMLSFALLQELHTNNNYFMHKYIKVNDSFYRLRRCYSSQAVSSGGQHLDCGCIKSSWIKRNRYTLVGNNYIVLWVTGHTKRL